MTFRARLDALRVSKKSKPATKGRSWVQYGDQLEQIAVEPWKWIVGVITHCGQVPFTFCFFLNIFLLLLFMFHPQSCISWWVLVENIVLPPTFFSGTSSQAVQQAGGKGHYLRISVCIYFRCYVSLEGQEHYIQKTVCLLKMKKAKSSWVLWGQKVPVSSWRMKMTILQPFDLP